MTGLIAIILTVVTAVVAIPSIAIIVSLSDINKTMNSVKDSVDDLNSSVRDQTCENIRKNVKEERTALRKRKEQKQK